MIPLFIQLSLTAFFGQDTCQRNAVLCGQPKSGLNMVLPAPELYEDINGIGTVLCMHSLTLH